jgi:hypothetical protein
MKRINLRELRDTTRLKSYLKAGEVVELCERNRVLGTIQPARGPLNEQWPDFRSLNEAIFGGRMLTGSDILSQERAR